jgi:carotenoid cleavage dioxygenase-like enzyme
MKYRLSSTAAVAFAAVLSALIMTVHPAQAQTCADVEVHNVRPEQGMLMIAAYADAAGFDFQRREPLRILVMKKDDIRERRVFELPAQMVFHVAIARERRDGSITRSAR